MAQINILPSWFSGWERGGIALIQDNGLVFAFDRLWQGRWGMALGGAASPELIVFGERGRKPTAELRYTLTL